MHGGDPSNGLALDLDLRAQVARHDAEIYGRGREEGLRQMVSDIKRDLATHRRLLVVVLALLCALVLAVGAGAGALVWMALRQGTGG